MTLIISEEQFYQTILHAEPGKKSSYETFEILLHDPKQLSQGYRRWMEVCEGMDILIDDYTLKEDLIVQLASGEPGSQLELSFSILGDNHHEQTSCGQNFFLVHKHSGDGGLFKWKGETRILKFDIHLDINFFKNLIAGEVEQLPQLMQQVIEEEDEIEYLHFAATTPAMQTLIQQVLNCPYQGITKRLYLESKALELIALRLEQIKGDTPTNTNNKLNSDTIDRIHFARDILIKNLDNPPSLIELARMVSLNDCTLKKGFREVFGTTAFGYLYNYRLETARNLLETGNTKVTEVLQMVGFRDRSYFASAFRKKFGVNPSIYLRGNEKNLRNSA